MKKTLAVLLAVAAFAGVSAVAVGCGDTDSEKPEHNHHLVWENTNETQHWQYCDLEGCDYVGEKTGHVDGKIVDGVAVYDGVCDDCGYVIVAPHDHTPTLTSDADSHWSYCTVDKCQYVTEKELHVDAVINETEAEGKDAKCDTCGHDIYLGHAANPAALTLDTQRLLAIKKDQKLYYEFTAEAANRYTIKLANGENSRKCQFTTTIEGDVWYGSECLEAEEHLDLEAGDTVTIILTCPVELEDGATVSVLVTETTDEPLPAHKFIDGEYTDGSTVIIIDRENEKISLNDVDYAYRYVGGSVDTLYFAQGTTTYSLKNVIGDEYDLSYTESNGGGTTTKHLIYLAPQSPIALSKFAGKYVPSGDDDINNISEFVIYESGNGSYVEGEFRQNWYIGEGDASYAQSTNTLRFNGYILTVALGDDGNAESITVMFNGETCVYTRDGDSGVEIPRYINIAVGEYIGSAGYALKRFPEGHCTLSKEYEPIEYGANVLIDDYDPENGVYTVSTSAWDFGSSSYVTTTYKVEIVDESTLKLYDAEDALLDTLVIFVPHFANLPSGEDEIVTSTVEKNIYLYKATEAGWYKIEWDEDLYLDLVVYYGLAEEDPTNRGGETVVQATNGEVAYFEAGDILGVYIGGFYPVPEKVAITVTKTTTPAGRTQDNPVVLEDGAASLNNVDASSDYYFKYTATKAGAYLVNIVTEDADGLKSYMVHYVINGDDYGYDPDSWLWYGMTAQDPYASITLGASEELIIKADRKGSWGVVTMTVSIIDDYAPTATDIDVVNEHIGTLVAGTYKVTDLSGEEKILGITLTSEEDMTVTVLGVATTTKMITIDEARLKKGFKLECEGSVSYSAACATTYAGNVVSIGGSEFVKLTISEDYSIAIYEVFGEEYTVYPVLEDGEYHFTYSEYGVYVSFTIAGEAISISDENQGNGTLEIYVPEEGGGEEGGDEVVDGISYSGDPVSFVFSKELADMEINESSSATYSDFMGNSTVTITKTGDGEYSYSGSMDGMPVTGTITLGDGFIKVYDDYYSAPYEENGSNLGELTLIRQ